MRFLQVEFQVRNTHLNSTVEMSLSKSRNEASLVVAGALCFVGSDVPFGCVSSSVDARFRFAGGRVVSGSWACGGDVDVPLATTSAADMVFVYQSRVDGLECLVVEAIVLRDGPGGTFDGQLHESLGERMLDMTRNELR